MLRNSILFCVLLLPFLVQGTTVEKSKSEDPIEPYSLEWRSELREARQAAANQLQLNLVATLEGLAESGLRNGMNITGAVANLTKAITRNAFDLVDVVGYLPKLLGQDLPTQFVEVLKRIRSSEIKTPSDVNSSIDVILAFSRQAEESGITNRVFGPITKVVPNLLSGANDFLVTIFSSVFSVLGVPPTTVV